MDHEKLWFASQKRREGLLKEGAKVFIHNSKGIGKIEIINLISHSTI